MNDVSGSLYTKNHILNSLPAEHLERLKPLLERVELPLSKILFHPEQKISHVYFPDRSMISVVAYISNGQGTEVAVIGREGVVGLDVVMGSDRATNQHITQLADGALRIKTADIRTEFARGGHFQEQMLLFMRKFIVQISQTALCNRLHTTEKRLSRWLLMCHDRAETDVMQLTQEMIAIMLGSNRTTVTMSAIELQNAGFITYSRGKKNGPRPCGPGRFYLSMLFDDSRCIPIRRIQPVKVCVIL